MHLYKIALFKDLETPALRAAYGPGELVLRHVSVNRGLHSRPASPKFHGWVCRAAGKNGSGNGILQLGQVRAAALLLVPVANPKRFRSSSVSLA